MKIILSPQRRDDALTVSKGGDILTINGETFDFSSLPDGATIPAGEVPCEWIVGPVERIVGELQLTLILPHGAAPEQWQAFPDAIVDPADGPLQVPHDTYSETTEQMVDGGTMVTVTTCRWHQAPEVRQTFVPAPPEPSIEEESANVDA